MKRRLAKAKSPGFSILLASDWAPIRAFDRIIRREPESVYGDLLPVLRASDLRIVNCECALASTGRPACKSGSVFRGEPAHVGGLTAVPFHVACLANNHVLDYGVAGMRQTLDIFRRNGIRSVGAGVTEGQACAPLTVRAAGAKIHIINFSEGEDLTAADGGPGVFGWDMPKVLSLVRGCKRSGGLVLAIGHCGLEYVPFPPPYVVAAFRAIADAGADCVVGHHPHVPQGMEWRRGRPIFYSLGNFAFFQETDLYYRKIGFCATLKCAGARITGVELHPYRITESGLSRLSGKEESSFHRTMTVLSKPFRLRDGHVKAWEAYLAHYGRTGFLDEVLGILNRMKTDAPKGAAMFRNRITTLQHSELWRDVLTRIMDGKRPKFSARESRIVEEFFNRRVEPQPPRNAPDHGRRASGTRVTPRTGGGPSR